MAVFLAGIGLASGTVLNAKLPPPNDAFYGLHNESVSSGAYKTYTFTPGASARYLQAGVAIITGAVDVEIRNGSQILNPSGQRVVSLFQPASGEYQIKVTGAGTGVSNYTVFWNQLITHMCVDADNDGYYKYNATDCPQGDDCNDANPGAHPGATEICNGINDNCNDQTDENVKNTYYRDYDNDGYGNASWTIEACSKPDGYADNGQDCNDSYANAHQVISCSYNGTSCGQSSLCTASCPAVPAEICNGIDDDCNGYIDNGLTGCQTQTMVNTSYYDGATTNFSNRAINLSRIEGLVLEKTAHGKIVFRQAVSFTQGVNLDFYTNISFNAAYINSTVFPMLNRPATVYLYNLTFLNPVILKDGQPCPQTICRLVSYSGGALVFNVTGFSVYSAAGSCADGTLYFQCSSEKPKYCDNGNLVYKCSVCNCSGTDLCYPDGKCVAKVCTEGANETCGNDAGACEFGTRKCVNNSWTECTGGTGPSPETCNGIDDDCDGAVDEGAGCCDEGAVQDCGNNKGICQYGTKTCTNGVFGPCQEDIKPNPGGEICGNGLDDDCDGNVDENCWNCTDLDKDGYGNPASSLCTYPEEDCNDSDPSVHPGAVEICNGKDDDCDGIVDENCIPGVDNETKLQIISMYRSGKSASQISAGLNLTIETVRTYIKCANGRPDQSEEGTDCGEVCPTECSLDYTWILLSVAGAGILGSLLLMYFRFRKEGKELTWEELKGRWA